MSVKNKKEIHLVKKLKETKAITLIALVITVIIMLILAMVAISALTSGDGLFSKVKEAANKYKDNSSKEAGDVATLNNLLETYVGGDENSFGNGSLKVEGYKQGYYFSDYGKLGSEIIISGITITNVGNITMTDITINDTQIGALEPGNIANTTVSYEITEEDILAGEVLLVSNATGTSPDPDEPDVVVTSVEDQEPCE